MRFGRGPGGGTCACVFPAPPEHLDGPAAAHALFARLGDEVLEVVAFAYLAGDGRVLGLRHSRSDWHDHIDLSIRTIAADAIAFDARGVVMAHNHPSGDPTPSSADRDATRRIAGALATLEVRLLDHLVVGSGRIASFRALGLL